MIKKTYTYFCVGYEGHECGLPVILKNKPRKNATPRCPSCVQMHRSQYQHDYYMLHSDKAKDYQAEYNRRFRKAQRAAAARKITSACTRKLEDREERRSVYHHSDLMHRAPESFEKAVNRILAGDADFTGVK